MILVSLLFFSAVISGLLVFLFKADNKNNIKLLLSFSGSYLFAISVVHLIPEVYSSEGSTIGVYVLAGFFLQLLLEFFSEGIEHGHVHVHKSATHPFPFSIILSLCIHSFLEGMPIANNNPEIQSSLVTGIILHNIPIAFALMTMLLLSQVKKMNAVFMLCVFAAMAPVGLMFSMFLGANEWLNMAQYYNKIMAIVIGIFLHISTTILFESTENHRFNFKKFAVIILGAFLALAL